VTHVSRAASTTAIHAKREISAADALLTSLVGKANACVKASSTHRRAAVLFVRRISLFRRVYVQTVRRIVRLVVRRLGCACPV